MLAQATDVEAVDQYRIAHNGYYGAYASTFSLLSYPAPVKYVQPATPEQRYTRVAFPDTEKLQAHLDAGNPAIIEVNWYQRFWPAIWKWTYGMHFVLLLPDMTIYDPWPTPTQNKSICSVSDFGSSLEEAVVRAVYYEVL